MFPGGYRERESERVMAQILDSKNPTPPGAAKAEKATSLGSVGMGQHRNPHPPTHGPHVSNHRQAARSSIGIVVYCMDHRVLDATGDREEGATSKSRGLTARRPYAGHECNNEQARSSFGRNAANTGRALR